MSPGQSVREKVHLRACLLMHQHACARGRVSTGADGHRKAAQCLSKQSPRQDERGGARPAFYTVKQEQVVWQQAVLTLSQSTDAVFYKNIWREQNMFGGGKVRSGEESAFSDSSEMRHLFPLRDKPHDAII